MPTKRTYREQHAWTLIAPYTYALQLPTGLLIRHDAGERKGESMVFVPGETLDGIAPCREVDVCVDGDPDCGDPECERKHAPSEDEEARAFGEVAAFRQKATARFYTSQSPELPDGWIGIFDRLAVRFVAAAPNVDGANRIYDLLINAAADELACASKEC